jgi:hypothetical protein
VNRNIYGKSKRARVERILVRKANQSSNRFRSEHLDECVFYHGSAVYILYTDDLILAGPNEDELNNIIDRIKSAGLDITEEGDLADFLGINIERGSDNAYHLSQPQLIDQIIRDLRLDQDNVTPKTTPAVPGKILGTHMTSPAFDNHFHYRSVIGKLNHLERGSRPDIAYAVHQCARFAANPRKEHGEAVKGIGRYLKGTRTLGYVVRPNNDQFQVWADADFSGNWIQDESMEEADTARSRTGYVIAFLGCSIMWKSQLQTEIRKVIPIMRLIQEMKRYNYHAAVAIPTVHCTLFEDNSGALTLAKAPAMRPRTKHINLKYNHFRTHVAAGIIDLRAIRSQDQPADILTKPLTESIFVVHRQTIMGWDQRLIVASPAGLKESVRKSESH